MSPYRLLAVSILLVGCGGDSPQKDETLTSPQPPTATIRKLAKRISPPAVDGDRIIVGTSDKNILVLDAALETIKTIPLGDVNPNTEPFILGEWIFVADAKGTVVGIRGGEKIWETEIDGRVNGGVGAARIGERLLVYAGSYSGNFQILDGTDGSEVAKTEVSGYINSRPALALQQRLAFVSDCGGQLAMLDMLDGQPRRTAQVDDHLPWSPLIVGDTAYVISHSGTIHAINLATAETSVFAKDENEKFIGTPAVHGETLYSATEQGKIRAYNLASRALQAEADFGSEPLSPVVVGKSLLVFSERGGGAAYALSDLSLRWRIDNRIEYQAPPLAFHGGFLISDGDGNLYFFKESGVRSQNEALLNRKCHFCKERLDSGRGAQASRLPCRASRSTHEPKARHRNKTPAHSAA